MAACLGLIGDVNLWCVRFAARGALEFLILILVFLSPVAPGSVVHLVLLVGCCVVVRNVLVGRRELHVLVFVLNLIGRLLLRLSLR
eukprot:5068429-Pleurochrysis_carterae.AAC.1